MAGSPDAETVGRLVAQMQAPTSSPAERDHAREQLVLLHTGLVEHLARRFSGRGEPVEDLVQVGMVGLLKAVDRFDPTREVSLAGFATPTVLGEIKRHFRDKGWSIRVPRHLQEMRLRLAAATEELTQRLQRSPTVADLAGYLEVSEEDVIQGLESSYAYNTQPLEVTTDDDADVSPSLRLGSNDAGFDLVVDRESLKPLLRALPEREQRLLRLRFFDGLTQTGIAAELGISQMHVSRLLSRTLESLREALLEDSA